MASKLTQTIENPWKFMVLWLFSLFLSRWPRKLFWNAFFKITLASRDLQDDNNIIYHLFSGWAYFFDDILGIFDIFELPDMEQPIIGTTWFRESSWSGPRHISVDSVATFFQRALGVSWTPLLPPQRPPGCPASTGSHSRVESTDRPTISY